ncbi:zinc finger protein Pegasus-like [Corythoichthys intestinalis]|uniref:zinc finger protein Pegasus-like n=1 Tax=Corythoichthys intestinalis TaxID=161448 RepID=UPI0025A5E759|nr:zinc finger protein Pegasus-like [Corythoichthys intestinalis]XP_061808086.1 zinc finger protein Pegasus-like [Nerophis lumbriciformis]
MEEIKTEPVDFVREFQEYLTQQTQHVNMISGSICEEKDPVAPRSEHNGLDPPSVEVSLPLEEGSDVQMDGLERTCDGKYKCSFCSYVNKGMARLIEHIRIHTGEKPHRCQLCPFASAYERHLEAHMRSHTGEKPYKCDLCTFRCSDRSNLSHHRRRRHKQPPARVVRPPFVVKRSLATLQKRSGSLCFGRRLTFTPPPLPKSDYTNDVPHKHHHHLNMSEQRNPPGLLQNDFNRAFNNPLEQLASLQPADLHSESSEVPANSDEKPIVIQEVTGARATTCSNGVQTLTPKGEYPASDHRSNAHGHGLDVHDEALCAGGSRPSTPRAAAPATTPECDEPQRCPHCDINFPDNVLYTIHMGCHVYEHPFRCNVCGHTCTDKYDFACHFAQGQHRK